MHIGICSFPGLLQGPSQSASLTLGHHNTNHFVLWCVMVTPQLSSLLFPRFNSTHSACV